MRRAAPSAEEMAERIGLEAARAGRPSGVVASRGSTEADVARLLRSAEPHAALGASMPPLARFRGILAFPARVAARAILYTSRFLTEPQAYVNATLLRAVGVLAAAVGRLERASPEPASGLDELCAALHDHLRGSREEIKERLRVYLPFLERASAREGRLPVLDVGCGRGEWLELLREEGWTASGVERNRALAERCRALELAVHEGDTFEHLRGLAAASRLAVTAFHVVEHWPFAALVAFLDEAYRVLVPGGVLILETPDPSNLLVSGWAFHLDPTHLRPLPRPLLKLVVEARGFADTEVLGLRPIGVPATMEPLELREWLESHFGGAQDYALVARRAQGG